MASEAGPGARSDESSTMELGEKPADAGPDQAGTQDSVPGEEAEDSKFAKRIIRKNDFRVLPLLGLIYTLAYVDRTNISVARISGLDEDVGLDIGSRASIALLVFFIGYIVFEIPSNIIIKKIGVANWISAITIAFGAFTLGQGFVHDWISLSVLRHFIGACKAKRFAFFYFTAQFLASFGSILAYGLIKISRVNPEYKGWRRIYIVEGAITILVGLVSGSFMYMTGAIGGCSFTLFLPIILQDSLGFSQELSFILVAPPVMFAVLVGGFAAWLADKWHIRGPFVVVLGVLALVGFCMMGCLADPIPRLVGVFIGEAGV
ncbi:related to putative tartrate transporter [Phialocephala subalpina]|uniref:Related to putative tartrate transporter n=1 Tax=Phialocephala subalpina TaxID=576137 RepID=A0A1L7XKY8_9HELO|nr:related to putative tartrate transporter [Phialocephala subalpina]